MHTLSSRSLLWVLAGLASLAAAPSALASPAPARTVEGDVTVRISDTASEALDGAPAAGTAAVSSVQVSARASLSLAPRTRLNVGLDWSRHDLDLSNSAWLPGTLSSLALPLGVTQTLDERWRLLVQVQPGLSSAADAPETDGFDMPVMALASYAPKPELTWSFGVRYSEHGDYRVMPLVGLTWKFAPAWEARLAFPESGLVYRATEALTLRAVTRVHGGNYRVADEEGAPVAPGGVSLRKAWLEYREIRTGLAASLALSPTFSLRVDAGAAFGRRFEYVDQGLTLKGGTPLYGTLALTARF